jgi:hypothetical protein
MRDGIVCWRSARINDKAWTGGQPWDIRSWEAEPWFLHKWQALLGGESHELWTQTQWWRLMRGKDIVRAQ